MAINTYAVVTGGTSVAAVAPASANPAIALTAAAAKSMWLINPATYSFVIMEFGIGFDGSTATAPIQVMLYRVNTIGTPAGTAATVQKFDPNAATTATTCLTNLTTEATSIDVLAAWPVAANNGMFVMQYPLGREPDAAAAGARLGLLVKTPASVSPNATSYVLWQE